MTESERKAIQNLFEYAQHRFYRENSARDRGYDWDILPMPNAAIELVGSSLVTVHKMLTNRVDLPTTSTELEGAAACMVHMAMEFIGSVELPRVIRYRDPDSDKPVTFTGSKINPMLLSGLYEAVKYLENVLRGRQPDNGPPCDE